MIRRGALIALLVLAGSAARAQEEAHAPYDCAALPLPTPRDPGYARAYEHWRKNNPVKAHFSARPEMYTVILHGATGTFERRVPYTHTWAMVRLCIADRDYRLRYHLNPLSSADLQPVVPPSLAGSAGGLKMGATNESVREFLSLLPNSAAALKIFDDATRRDELTAPTPPPDGKPRALADILAQTQRHAEVAKRLDALLKNLKDELPQLAKALEAEAGGDATAEKERDQLLELVKHASDELTGEVPVLQARADELRARLESVQSALYKLANADTRRARARRMTSDLHAFFDELVKHASDQNKKLRDKLTDRQSELTAAGAVAGADATQKAAVAKLIDDTNKAIAANVTAAASVKAALDALGAVQTNGAAPAPTADLRQALAMIHQILDHFALVDQNLFYIPIDKDKEFTITVSSARLTLVARDAAQNGGGGAGGSSGSGGSGGDQTAPQYSFKYTEVPNGDVSVKFQVRSFTWFRANIGLAFTSLRDPGYQLGFNDTGAQVITHGSDPGIIPMFVLSHYWCGVDLREIQPYDRFRECGWANTFLPTFALGIPLSRDPTRNLFVGGLLQPVPGLAFIAGAHLGEIRVLRHGYVDGQQPPLVQGQAFDISQAQESQLRLGYFVGFVITDSIFVPFISKIAGLN